jgi:hypothetical protein
MKTKAKRSIKGFPKSIVQRGIPAPSRVLFVQHILEKDTERL